MSYKHDMVVYSQLSLRDHGISKQLSSAQAAIFDKGYLAKFTSNGYSGTELAKKNAARLEELDQIYYLNEQLRPVRPPDRYVVIPCKSENRHRPVSYSGATMARTYVIETEPGSVQLYRPSKSKVHLAEFNRGESDMRVGISANNVNYSLHTAKMALEVSSVSAYFDSGRVYDDHVGCTSFARMTADPESGAPVAVETERERVLVPTGPTTVYGYHISDWTCVTVPDIRASNDKSYSHTWDESPANGSARLQIGLVGTNRIAVEGCVVYPDDQLEHVDLDMLAEESTPKTRELVSDAFTRYAVWLTPDGSGMVEYAQSVSTVVTDNSARARASRAATEVVLGCVAMGSAGSHATTYLVEQLLPKTRLSSVSDMRCSGEELTSMTAVGDGLLARMFSFKDTQSYVYNDCIDTVSMMDHILKVKDTRKQSKRIDTAIDVLTTYAAASLISAVSTSVHSVELYMKAVLTMYTLGVVMDKNRGAAVYEFREAVQPAYKRCTAALREGKITDQVGTPLMPHSDVPATISGSAVLSKAEALYKNVKNSLPNVGGKMTADMLYAYINNRPRELSTVGFGGHQSSVYARALLAIRTAQVLATMKTLLAERNLLTCYSAVPLATRRSIVTRAVRVGCLALSSNADGLFDPIDIRSVMVDLLQDTEEVVDSYTMSRNINTSTESLSMVLPLSARMSMVKDLKGGLLNG